MTAGFETFEELFVALDGEGYMTIKLRRYFGPDDAVCIAEG